LLIDGIDKWAPQLPVKIGMLIAHLFDTFPNSKDFNETTYWGSTGEKMCEMKLYSIYFDLDVHSYIVSLASLTV